MLRIENMTFTYKGHLAPAVQGINLHVPPGQIVLLTGASGSGKSTLLHCINGLATEHYGGLQQGDIRVAGRELTKKPLWEISEVVGTVFQNPNTQFFQMNVEDEIVFGMEHAHFERREIEKRLTKSLYDTGIESLRCRDIFSLSSGERQKVAMASILALEQPLLLMDEPTANLDIAAIHDLKDILCTLRGQGRTLLISEHRLWFLRGIVDRVVTIQHGEIVYDGVPDVLSDNDFRRRFGLRMWDKLPYHQTQTISEIDRTDEPALRTELLAGGGVKKTTIVSNASITVNKGHCVAIMGYNGAGKTTLSRIITGLEKEKKGSVWLAGRRFKSKERIGKIACVAQQADQQLFADSVIEEMLFGQPDDSITREKIGNSLNSFDLTHLRDRHPHSLSGGEKQRLAIAAAIIKEPALMILDEPTSGLDGFHMNRLAAEIDFLRQKGLSFIVITHDMELVMAVCDEIIWMESGTIRQTISSGEFNEFFEKLLENNKLERLAV
jgi:energy-coupling factor transport system ATP-binding protein